MGSCMSKGSAIDEVTSPPPPHPHARRLWLVATVVDPQQIPSDLVGIEADGLKAAMRNRGLETEHWALKVDPPPNVKAEYTIFDITVEDNKLVSKIHPASSPYCKIIQRRAAIGWTIWTDDEIFEATKLLIAARPKYDGRTNNSQTSARLLGRHIDLAQQQQQHAARTASETTAATSMSPTASSILHKPGSLELDGASALINNQSQITLASGVQSHLSQPSESELNEKADSFSDTVSRMPASIRQSQRLSVARPPLIHLSTTPSVAGSDVGGKARPTLARSPEAEHGTGSTTGSVRLSLPPQPRQQSPLNPAHRKSVSELRTHGRSRTQSDAQMYGTVGGGAADVRLRSTTRRRSEAPAEWLSDLPSSATRSRRNTNRDSVLSLGGGGSVAGGYGASMLASPMATWAPSMMPPPSPTMLGMPMPAAMGGYGMPPMPMWPNGGGMGVSPSMTFNPHALQIPVAYFSHGGGMGMGMPMLAPPSPGFYSHTSSAAVPTPPESPQMLSTHMAKSVPDIGHLAAAPVRA